MRAEEVNEGERILDLGRKTQIETDPKVAVLNQIISLGSLNRTTSFEQKDKLSSGNAGSSTGRSRSTRRAVPASLPRRAQLAPPLYIDPNEILRHQIKTNGDMLAKANTPSKKPQDGRRQATPKSKKWRRNPPPSNSNLSIPDQLDSIFDQLIKAP